jgi:cytochrome c oxidase subunit 2
MTLDGMNTMQTLAAGPFKSMQDLFSKYNFRSPSDSALGEHSDYLFFLIFLLSAFFFVLLMAMMVVFVIKYRKRPGQTPQRSAQHNTILELSWSVIPTLLLVWIFFEGFYGYVDKVVAPTDAQDLTLTAQKWNWSVTYPNGAASSESTFTRTMFTSPGAYDAPAKDSKVYDATTGKLEDAKQVSGTQGVPIFVVPEGEPVRLRMSSVDVIHSFWIPDFRVKFDVMPNRYTAVWFTSNPLDPDLAHKNGWMLNHTIEDAATKKLSSVPLTDSSGKQYLYNDHWVFCAEYCGQKHSEMSAIVRVVPVAAYQQIVQEWAEPKGSDAEKGSAYYKILGCNACHSVDGSRVTGPTWKNMYGHAVEFADGSRMSDAQMSGVDFDNYVRESILYPSAKIVAGYPNQMQSYQGRANPQQISYLIAYIKSLSDKAPPVQTAAPAGASAPGAKQGDAKQPAAQPEKK